MLASGLPEGLCARHKAADFTARIGNSDASNPATNSGERSRQAQQAEAVLQNPSCSALPDAIAYAKGIHEAAAEIHRGLHGPGDCDCPSGVMFIDKLAKNFFGLMLSLVPPVGGAGEPPHRHPLDRVDILLVLRTRAAPWLAREEPHLVHTTRPMPEKMSNAQTASSNWRSESRLKIFKPNHVPSSAAGRKTSTFQSICAAV